MGDLIDQLRERAERAERERDYLRDIGRAYQETEAALRAERDEARDALRALRHGLGQDDGPRRAAIAEADRAIASWGAQVPGPLADLRLSRDAWRDRALAAERERDEARRVLDGVRDALLTVREDGETCAAAVARLLADAGWRRVRCAEEVGRG